MKNIPYWSPYEPVFNGEVSESGKKTLLVHEKCFLHLRVTFCTGFWNLTTSFKMLSPAPLSVLRPIYWSRVTTIQLNLARMFDRWKRIDPMWKGMFCTWQCRHLTFSGGGNVGSSSNVLAASKKLKLKYFLGSYGLSRLRNIHTFPKHVLSFLNTFHKDYFLNDKALSTPSKLCAV